MVSYTWREEFGYDGAGNRIQKRNGWGAVDYTYSGENRLIRAGGREYEYDGNGNVTQESAAGGRRRYFYNSLNRVQRAEVNEGMARILNYEYDGLGRRIGMSSTLSGNTHYGYSGLGLNPIEEVFERGFGLPNDPRGSRNEGRTAPESGKSSGRGRYMPYRKNRLTNQARFPQRQTPSMSETRSYVYKGRVPAARSAVGDGELRTLAYGHDALGSIRAVVSHGTVQEQYDYDAFGKPFGDELETDERGYNGKPYDAVLGHYNYGFRDYDPMTGRFATVDPIRDGRNWYVYVRNNPLNMIDAWGLAAEDRGLTQNEIDYMTEIIGDSWRGQHQIDYSAIKVYDRGATTQDSHNINQQENVGIPAAVLNAQPVELNRPKGLPGGNIFLPPGTPEEVKLHEVVHTQHYIEHGNQQAITTLMNEQANYAQYQAGGRNDESLNPYNYQHPANSTGNIQTLDDITTLEGQAAYIEDFAANYSSHNSANPYSPSLMQQATVLQNSGFNSTAITNILSP